MTLREFFEENREIAIALSGGIDSIFLMYMAKKYGAKACGYFVKSEFQPAFEREDVRKAVLDYGFNVREIELSVIKNEDIIKNGPDRCYHCKRNIISAVVDAARSDGYELVADGTNASDDISSRPGYRALCEFSVLSPLRICGITKAEVRRLSREAGIFAWSKPSYACLATRIKTGERITQEKLAITENAEDFLRSRGLSDFRVRLNGSDAKLELSSKEKEIFDKNREQIVSEIRKYYGSVIVDLGARDERVSY